VTYIARPNFPAASAAIVRRLAATGTSRGGGSLAINEVAVRLPRREAYEENAVTERTARLDGLRSVSSSRLSGQVVQQFVTMIRNGELAPGERLPTERDLAERFGVGRNSIREALRQLNMLGLVTSRHGEGTFVGTPDAAQLMAPFRAVIELSTPAAESVLEFRLAFEPGVAALAARNISEEGERRLRAALEKFENALTGEEARAEHTDASFHFAVAQTTENPTVIAVHRALLELLTGSRSGLSRDTYQPDNRVAVGHRELYAAILSRDEDKARSTMQQHLRDVSEGLAGK
jgi:GntR family transcriptional regulator, transcriptional repressor for pyruvate dehydrogenase complex